MFDGEHTDSFVHDLLSCGFQSPKEKSEKLKVSPVVKVRIFNVTLEKSIFDLTGVLRKQRSYCYIN